MNDIREQDGYARRMEIVVDMIDWLLVVWVCGVGGGNNTDNSAGVCIN